MAGINDSLKSILQDANLICQHKINLIKEKHGADKQEVKDLQKKVETMLGHFSDPNLWAVSIEYDEVALMNHILEMDLMDPANLDLCVQTTANLIEFLRKEILEPASLNADASTISDINLRVLNALRLTRQSISGRKQYFKNQGNDLDADPDFQEAQTRQDTAVQTYRDLLKKNEIEAKEIDVVLISRFGISFSSQTELDKFLFLYGKFTELIESKLPATA